MLLTPNTNCTLIDTPGFKTDMKNIISGIQGADSSILVVDGSKGMFEVGFSKDGTTKFAPLLTQTHGIKLMIVAVNKLDPKADFKEQEARFVEIKTELI